MEFEQWWKEYLDTFKYSNVSEESIAIARSAASAAWDAGGVQGFTDGRAGILLD